jgi:hypothetical protein
MVCVVLFCVSDDNICHKIKKSIERMRMLTRQSSTIKRTVRIVVIVHREIVKPNLTFCIIK